MEYRNLGRTGVKVSALCLGAMMFGEWGNQDHDDCARIVHRALDAGINFIDTSDVYSAGESEEIVGKALSSIERERVVVATKFANPMGDHPNARGNSRRWIVTACENSLRRLGLDYIDLYQAHMPDLSLDVDETLGALTDLVRAGKIRYFGSSNFLPSQIVEAQWTAERRGRERFISEQPPYSILVRGIEAEHLPTCERYGMGVVTWSPLAGGWLSGKYGSGAENASHRATRYPAMYDTDQARLAIVDALATVARDAGLTMVEMALAFVLEHPAVSAAIIGPRTMEQLESQLHTSDMRLEVDVLDRIDQIVAPGLNVEGINAGITPPTVTALNYERRRARAGLGS